MTRRWEGMGMAYHLAVSIHTFSALLVAQRPCRGIDGCAWTWVRWKVEAREREVRASGERGGEKVTGSGGEGEIKAKEEGSMSWATREEGRETNAEEPLKEWGGRDGGEN